MPEDVGAEEAGVFDEVGVEVGKMSDTTDDKTSDTRGRAREGVPDEDVDEMGVWDCEDDAELDGTSVDDAEGKIHWPRRFRPRGHAALVGEDVEGEEDWGLLVVGVGVGVEEKEDGGSVVCGRGEEDELGNSPEPGNSPVTALRGSDEVVVAVGAVVAGESLVDGDDDEVPPESGKKMAAGQSGKETEE